MKLKTKVAKARGKNKVQLVEFLNKQRVGSLDNEIRVLTEKQEAIQQQIYKLQDKRAKIIAEYFNGQVKD